MELSEEEHEEVREFEYLRSGIFVSAGVAMKVEISQRWMSQKIFEGLDYLGRNG